MFPMPDPDARRAASGRRSGSATATPCWRATNAGPSAPRRRQHRPSGDISGRVGCPARRPGGADDLEPARSSWWPINGISKIGAAAVLLSPAWKARRGRARAASSPNRCTLWPTGRPSALLAELLRARAVSPTSTQVGSRRSDRSDGAESPDRGDVDTDEAVLVFSSGTTGLPKAVRHTHRSMGCATAHWCADARPRPGRPFPGGDAALAHPRSAEPAGGGRGRGHRAPAPSVRPRRGAPLHRGGANDPRDGGGPDRAGDGQPPRSREVRPVLVALHHVGGDAGQ